MSSKIADNDGIGFTVTPTGKDAALCKDLLTDANIDVHIDILPHRLIYPAVMFPIIEQNQISSIRLVM